MENKCRIIDELLTFEFNLKNDLEMIKICQNNLKYEKNSTKKQYQDILNDLIAKINEEIYMYNVLKQKLQKKDFEVTLEFENKLELIKLRYTKLSLTIEKVLISQKEFQSINEKLPQKIRQVKIQSQSDYQFDQQSETVLDKNNQTIQLQQQFQQLRQSEKLKIKQELTSIKDNILETKEKIYNHEHNIIKKYIENVKDQNKLILSNHNIIKEDNAQIMQQLFKLIQSFQIMQKENEILSDEINRIKQIQQIQSP